MKGGTFAVLASLGATALLSGAIIVVSAMERSVPTIITPRATPIYLDVFVEPTNQSQSAVMQVSYSPDIQVVSTGASGIITELKVAKGSELLDGTHLMTVEGIRVSAHVSEIPIYRELQKGSEGPDVFEVQRFLVAHTDASFTPNGKFGTATEQAVKLWEKSIGVEPVGIVDPTWFVRISAPLTVKSTELKLGVPVPALGNTLLVGDPQLDNIKIEPALEVAPGEYLFQGQFGKLEVAFDGALWSSKDPALLLDALTVTPSLDGGPAEASSDGTGKIDGRLSLITSLSAVAVPAAAIVASDDGETVCVWTEENGVPVLLTGLSIMANTASGAVLIDDQRLAEQRVMANPLLALEDPICP